MWNKHKKFFWIFCTALILRLTIYIVYDPPLFGDTEEYFINSQTMSNTTGNFEYDYWFQRTPLYLLYLNVTHQNLLIQIIISVLTCVLLEKLFLNAGWLFAFYLPGIIYCNTYMKETLLTFLFVVAVYLFRRKKNWLILFIPIIFMGFISYGPVWDYNTESASLQKSFTYKIWALWRPDWNYSMVFPHPGKFLEILLRNVSMLLYIPTMIIFFRKIHFKDYELWLALFITLVAIFSFGLERYREPVMPFIIGYTLPYYKSLFNKFTTNHRLKIKE